MDANTLLVFWIFNGVVLLLLLVDLWVFHRHAEAVSMREAGWWSAFWIVLSLAFGAAIWLWKGSDPALEFLTGYVIEKSLSVDNIFVFLLIFRHFKVPDKSQFTVLFYGVVGAIVLRGIMIALGSALITRFDWVLYLFGLFLIYTGIKFLFTGETGGDPADNPLVKFARRHLPLTDEYHGAKFFIRKNGARCLTPLALVVLVLESSDLIFALDSIPAVFGVTRDFFIVFTSNICAVLGLRALYFLLAGLEDRFRYLKTGVALVLALVGVKMLLKDLYEVPILWSLLGIAIIFASAIFFSWFWPGKKNQSSSA